MEQATEIKGIRLQLGRKEIELTVDEARNLKRALEDLFGRDVVREVHDHWHWWGWQTVPWTATWSGGGTVTVPDYLPYVVSYGGDGVMSINCSTGG